MIVKRNSQPDWRKALELLQGAYAKSTIDAYYRDFTVFVQWCDAHAIRPLPCEGATVALFLDAQSALKAAATVRRYAVSVGKVHRLLGLEDPTRAEAVHLALRRSRRAATAPQRQSLGLTRADIEAIVCRACLSPLHLRDAAMIALGFDTLARRSEIVALRTGDVEFLSDGAARVLLRRGKTDQAARGRVAWVTPSTASVLKRWLEWRGGGGYLFAPLGRACCGDRPLNPVAVQRAIRRAVLELGLSAVSDYTGHALRVGAAQELLRMGRDTAGIMRAGGWKSVATLARYLERAEHSVWA